MIEIEMVEIEEIEEEITMMKDLEVIGIVALSVDMMVNPVVILHLQNIERKKRL